MLVISDFMQIIAIVCACFTGTTASGSLSNLAYAGKGVWENVYSYLPLIERQLTFRRVRGLCDAINLEQNNLNGTLELKGYLNEIHDQWDTWNARTEQFKRNYIREIRDLHCRLSAEEQYALQTPRILSRWKDAILRGASVVISSVVDQEARKEIVRRVFEAVRFCPFYDHQLAEGADYHNVDRISKELIRHSRRLSSGLLASSQEMHTLYSSSERGFGDPLNVADLKCMSLWYQHLWDHISARNGSLLPPRDTMFQIQNKAQSQYLKHLIADCSFALIHPMYLNHYLDHKLYWEEMDRVHEEWERILIGAYRMFHPGEDIYGMFRQKFVIMAMRSMRYDGDGIGQFQRWRQRNEEWLSRATQRKNIGEENDLAQQLSRELMYW